MRRAGGRAARQPLSVGHSLLVEAELFRHCLPVEVIAVTDDLAVQEFHDPHARAYERATRRLIAASVGARQRTVVRSTSTPLVRNQVVLANERHALDDEIGKCARKRATSINELSCPVDRVPARNVRPLAVLSNEVAKGGPIAIRERLTERTNNLDVAFDRHPRRQA